MRQQYVRSIRTRIFSDFSDRQPDNHFERGGMEGQGSLGSWTGATLAEVER